MKKMNGKQSGFTIIELVVVILLLGILAATALPRFIDVTDDARAAVVQATSSAMTTGAALYRAQWVAEGSVPGDVPGTGQFTLAANANGYPALGGTDPQDCVDIYNDLLQAGRVAATAAAPAGTVCTFTLGDNGDFTYDTDSGQTVITP